MQTLINIIVFILILGIVVLIHEFGHFITAKSFGVYCSEFSIGMGPKLFSKKIGETEYEIRALPIGGFVSMAGEADNEIEEYLNSLPVGELKYRCGLDKYSGKAVDSHTHTNPIQMKLLTSTNTYTGKTVLNAEYDLPKESDGEWNYKAHTIQENIDNSICPECGSKLRFSEGCMKCDNCGFSKC